MTRFYEEVMAPAGVTVPQFALLRALERSGPIPMSRLAEELVMDRTSLYRAVQPLIRDEFVLTRSCDTDRRVKEAELSKAGKRKIREALPYWRKAQKAFVSDFGEEAWSGTSASLARVVSLIQGATVGPSLRLARDS
jgi:DNA-binding MarR family transcriptional regulator